MCLSIGRDLGHGHRVLITAYQSHLLVRAYLSTVETNVFLKDLILFSLSALCLVSWQIQSAEGYACSGRLT